MVLSNVAPAYVGKRKAAITAWFGDGLGQTTRYQLVMGRDR